MAALFPSNGARQQVAVLAQSALPQPASAAPAPALPPLPGEPALPPWPAPPPLATTPPEPALPPVALPPLPALPPAPPSDEGLVLVELQAAGAAQHRVTPKIEPSRRPLPMGPTLASEPPHVHGSC